MTDMYKEFKDSFKCNSKKSIRIKPPRSIYDRLKSKSHQKFLKNLEKGKETKPKKSSNKSK
jgi:hypothetical protein